MSPALKQIWNRIPSDRQTAGDTQQTSLKLAIWTTTAWSLPGNAVCRLYICDYSHKFQGVAVHAEMQYLLVENDCGEILVIAEDRLGPIREILGSLHVHAHLTG